MMTDKKNSWQFLLPFIALIPFLLTGCIESKQTYTVNPDTSGKMALDITFQPFDLMNDAEKETQNTEKLMKEEVKRIITGSQGVESWKDVSYQTLDDGRISFQGTAYFKNLSQLELKNVNKMDIHFEKNEHGQMILELATEDAVKPKETKTQKLSEKEREKQLKQAKGKYKQARPMMLAFLSNLKMEASFYLPGTLEKTTNFTKKDDGSLQIVFAGEKILEAMDKIMADDTLLRAEIVSGRQPKDGVPQGHVMNEKLFGEKGPIQAIVSGEFKPLFNYDQEVAQAKKNFPKIQKALGITS